MYTQIFEVIYIFLLGHCFSISGTDISRFFFMSHPSASLEHRPQILPVVQIFSLTIMTYLKNLIENCYLKIASSFSSLTLHAVTFFL